jgi:hypothetical protein
MERLISLFRQPNGFELAEEEAEGFPYPWLENQENGEPEYFVQLMQYLRDRRENSVREGAD